VSTEPVGAARGGPWGVRLLALVPIVLLVAIAAAFVASGNSITGLVGSNPPPPDTLEMRRVEFHDGRISLLVRNPQPEDITIAVVTVDDAVVPFTVDGPTTLGRLRSATIQIPFTWVEDDPYLFGVTTSTGIQSTIAVDAAVATPEPDGAAFGGYALIGLLVGVVPVALGMLWLPSLRRADPRWMAAFMALTGGLLTFLAVDALAEALELQGALPGALGGPGLVLAGVALSYLGLAWVAHRLSRRGSGAAVAGAPLAGLALATMVAIGIGIHNFSEGLAIGSSFAVGQLALGTFLVVGFMVHNVTEGLGIVAPVAEGRRVSVGRLAVLALVAGAPTILGAWIGGFLTNEILVVLFFSLAVGAALQVVVEVGRYIARRAPGGLGSGWVVGGFLAGIAIMYATGLIAG
jgi:ZIP family zinc transporter